MVSIFLCRLPVASAERVSQLSHTAAELEPIRLEYEQFGLDAFESPECKDIATRDGHNVPTDEHVAAAAWWSAFIPQPHGHASIE